MSTDTLLMNGGSSQLNGTQLDYSGEASNSQEQVAINSSAVEQTYDSLFPALPDQGLNSGRSANIPQWSTSNQHSNANGSDLSNNGHTNKIMKVRSSKITEHFTILSEEKRDTKRICREIAQETNTDIEMTSTSKGLTFLITGMLIILIIFIFVCIFSFYHFIFSR